jgi:GNAT superfamily N-acetyltransferase
MDANKKYEIARAVEADVPVLLAMIQELAEFENRREELEVTQDFLRDALFGITPVAWALLACVAGMPAGYAVYYRTFSTFAGRPGIFLEDLYVRPAYRRHGLGRALLEQTFRMGGGDPGGRYEWIALRWNENALSFYKGLGARQLDDWVCVRMSGDPLHRLIEGGNFSWN